MSKRRQSGYSSTRLINYFARSRAPSHGIRHTRSLPPLRSGNSAYAFCPPHGAAAQGTTCRPGQCHNGRTGSRAAAVAAAARLPVLPHSKNRMPNSACGRLHHSTFTACALARCLWRPIARLQSTIARPGTRIVAPRWPGIWRQAPLPLSARRRPHHTPRNQAHNAETPTASTAAFTSGPRSKRTIPRHRYSTANTGN